MTSPLITYKRKNGGFNQSFFLNQNGKPFDLSKVSGTIVVIWWFLKDDPSATPLKITWSGSYSGTDNNKVTFAVPSGFFTENNVDYDSDVEVYNDQGLILSTDPSFIVRINLPAGIHTD